MGFAGLINKWQMESQFEPRLMEFHKTANSDFILSISTFPEAMQVDLEMRKKDQGTQSRWWDKQNLKLNSI